MNNGIQPIFILSEGTQRTSGRPAQSANIQAARAVAEAVRTTLGPKGMDKMLVDSIGDIIVTNDGVTILREMNIENPAAKMVVEIAKTQEDEVGDGTTTAVVLAGELLKEAEVLLEQNIHPTIISKGYRLALDHALATLKNISRPLMVKDTDFLRKIAMTAMTGKGAENAKEHLADLAVEAIQSVFEHAGEKIDLETVKIEKKSGGNAQESKLVRGIVLDKERVHPGMPKNVTNAKIALIDTALEIKNTEIDAKISITDPSQIQSFIAMEEKMLKDMVEKVVSSGANVVFCQKGIDDVAQHFLAKKGIYALRRVSRQDMEKIGRATGAKITSNLDEINPEDLGKAGSVAEQKVGDELMTFINDCENPKSVTMLLRGSTEHVLEEIKRAIDDSLGDLAAALRDGRVVAGAGSPEAEVAKELRKLSDKYSGREQLAIQAFSKAMEVIPKTLAENSGLDPIDALTELRSVHDKGNVNWGLNVETGKVFDAWKEGILEPLSVKTQAITSATEVSIMILRIDDVISNSNQQGQSGAGQGGMQMPPGMGGMPDY